MKSFVYKAAAVAAFAAVAFLVVSCGDFKKSAVVNPPSLGTADFSVYVALGNSLTAGYQSGALYESAQEYSFPADIARQAGVVAASFQQPLISDPGIGGRMKILSLSGPVIGSDPAGAGVPQNSTLARPYNNLGVPGAVLADLLYTTDFNAQANPAGRNNPFFSIVLRSSQFGSNMVNQALALHPTFVTVWIGANDVLGYATSGGVEGMQGPGTGPTDGATFAAIYAQTMDSLLAGAPNAKFAVANIPDVTAIPFFTTVPDSFASPITGKNVGAFIVERHHADGSLHGETVNAKYDYILLTAIDSLNAGVGVPLAAGGTGRPLPDQFVLDSLEVAKTEAAINSFNQTIAAYAAAHASRIALVDAHALLNDFNQYGFVGQGVELASSYITGGFFGLDGVHPTSQGYAYVANAFIKAINSKFGANIPVIAISSVPSSITLGKTSLQKSPWPNVSSSALHSFLRLLPKGNRQN
jgi:GDSL-like Lipase/Acylhydrolase